MKLKRSHALVLFFLLLAFYVYFYKIKDGFTDGVISLLGSEFAQKYIKLISRRTGPRSLRSKDLLKLKV